MGISVDNEQKQLGEEQNSFFFFMVGVYIEINTHTHTQHFISQNTKLRSKT